MGQEPQPESRSWWQTLPGLLTAAAGTITALTGLLVVLHQVGCLGRYPSPAAQIQSHPAADSAQPTQTELPRSDPPASVTTSRSLTLPANVEVRSADIVNHLAEKIAWTNAYIMAYSRDWMCFFSSRKHCAY